MPASCSRKIAMICSCENLPLRITSVSSSDRRTLAQIGYSHGGKVKSTVLFSYARGDAKKARAALDRILTSAGPLLKYELSKLIIERVENFAISPKHFRSWSHEKIAVL